MRRGSTGLGQGCARFSPGSANRCGQFTCHPRRTSSPLRPSLSFWYTHRSKGKRSAGVGGDMPEPLKWYDDNADNPPWIKALAEVRRLAPREGWRYQHVQAIIVSIDQYAEAALGNREFFLNKPYGIGGGRTKNNIP